MFLRKIPKNSKYTFSFYNVSSKNIQGFYFTIQPNTSEITQGEKVQVYEAPEWNELNSLLLKNKYWDIVPRTEEDIESMNNAWENSVMSSSFKSKYFALLPFFVEDRNTQQAKKKFVLNMELYPETKYMKFQCSMVSGTP